MNRALIILISCISLLACTKDQRNDCVTSQGEVVTIDRTVSEFKSIYVEDRIKLILVQDSSKHGMLELTGPSNLLPQITSETTDDEIELRNTNTCNFARSFDYEISIKIYVSTLENLTIESIAEVTTADTLFIEKLNIYHNALSDIDLILGGNELFIESNNSAQTTLSGKINVMKGSIEEISNLNASNLICKDVLIDSHTPLDCEITATSGIFVNLYNKGNIYHHGEPSEYKIVSNKTSTGSLILK